MKSEIKNFGIYGKDADSISEDLIHLVSIDSSCRKHNWMINPHFHSQLYQFFFIESGSGVCLLNDKSKTFEGVHLIIVPENTLHGFQFKEDIKGYTLSVSSRIIEKITDSDKELFFEVNKARMINMNNHFEEFNDAMDSIRRMNQELSMNAAKTHLFLETILLLLFVKIFRFRIDKSKDYLAATKELVYYRSFMKMIKSEIPTNKSIEHYTKAIGISKTHLNRVCQAITGKPTKQVICDFLLSESMVLMTHTDKTVSEIAYQLEFKDVSYFCRFFKKQTGYTPAQFRIDSRNNINQKILYNY